MSQEEKKTILRNLHLQRRNVVNEIKIILDKSETGKGLSKNEIENERKRLQPLLSEFVSNYNIGVKVFEESDEDNSKVIENLKAHMESMKLKSLLVIMLVETWMSLLVQMKQPWV